MKKRVFFTMLVVALIMIFVAIYFNFIKISFLPLKRENVKRIELVYKGEVRIADETQIDELLKSINSIKKYNFMLKPPSSHHRPAPSYEILIYTQNNNVIRISRSNDEIELSSEKSCMDYFSRQDDIYNVLKDDK